MPRNIFQWACVLTYVGVSIGCGALTSGGATQIYERECASGDGTKCLYLGARLVEGEGVAADPTRGRDLLGKACDRDVAQACAMLADLLLRGTGGPADPAAANEMLAKACQIGHEASCAKVKKQEPRSDELSPEEQVEWCDQGKIAQCIGLGAAWLLSAESEEAASNAAVYLDKACQDGANAACVMACELVPKGKGTKSCGMACDGGHREACLALSRDATGLTKQDLLEKACRAGDGRTCFTLHSAREKEATQQEREAWLVLGCAGNDAASCAQLGWAKATAGDLAASDILAKACSLGDIEACLLSGLPQSEQKDSILEKGCGARQALDCATLSSRLFTKGSSSWKKALAKAEQACRLEPGPWCLSAAVLTTRLASTKDAEAKSRKLAETACDAAHGPSCRYLATGTKRRAFLDKGCDAGDTLSCTLSGESWQQEVDGPKDGLRAMASFGKGCNLKDASACQRHGELLAQLAYDSLSEQLQAFEAACNLGSAQGCRQAALRRLEGEADLSASRRQAQAACHAGDAEGCRIAGDLFAEGQGGSKDLGLAKSLFEKACDSALVVACVQRGKLR